jgi:hypothetical protein
MALTLWSRKKCGGQKCEHDPCPEGRTWYGYNNPEGRGILSFHGTPVEFGIELVSIGYIDEAENVLKEAGERKGVKALRRYAVNAREFDQLLEHYHSGANERARKRNELSGSDEIVNLSRKSTVVCPVHEFKARPGRCATCKMLVGR